MKDPIHREGDLNEKSSVMQNIDRIDGGSVLRGYSLADCTGSALSAWEQIDVTTLERRNEGVIMIFST